MHLSAGYDLSYSWQETLRNFRDEISPELYQQLALQEGEGVARRISALSSNYPINSHRLWFATICDLYASGAGLCQAVGAMATFLRKEHESSLEEHCRTLPAKTNVLLLLFFLPPTLWLLLVPLVWELLHAIAVD